MKIARFNAFFAALGAFQLRFRWAFLAVAAVLVAIGVSGIARVGVMNSRDAWFDDSEAIAIATDRFEERFGNNDTIGVLVSAEDVLDPEVLTAIRDLGDALLEEVPYADDVSSLVELEISVGTDDGIEIINPFEDGIPDDPERIEEIRALLSSRQALVNRLFSDDFTETWLTLDLLEYPDEEEWSQVEGAQDPMFESGEAAIAVVTDPRWQSDRFTFKASGLPYTETEERDYFGREAQLRVMSGFGLMVVLLALFLRSVRGVIVPVFTTVMGVVVVFGCMGWLGVGIDANMVTLPIMLGMGLSVSYSIHIVNAFKRALADGRGRREAAVAAVEETGWPIFFTAVTTMGSVMSFAAVGIETLQWLGLTCASVVLADYLFVMTLVPILLSFGRDREAPADGKVTDVGLSGLMARLSELVIRRRRTVVVAVALFVLVTLPGAAWMQVNMDLFKFMGLEVPYVKRVWEVTQSQLGSYLAYNITIEFEEPHAIKDPAVLRDFDALLERVGDFELTQSNKGVPRVFSVLDIVKEMNQTFHGDDPAWYRVPDSRDLVAQLLLLYEISGGTKTFRWVDENYAILRAQVQVSRFDANEITRELEIIRAFGAERFPGATVSVVGSAVQFAELNRKIVDGEIRSMITALVVVAVLMVIVFGSVKTALIGMIPNTSPLAAIAGYMGYFDSPLDMMTMTIMPMLLGIAVDDTIHFINQMKVEFETGGSYDAAIRGAFATVGTNLAMTTIVIGGTFLMFTPSPISNMARIGTLACTGLFVALITDYLATPSLISLTRPFGEPRSAA
ncbi:MAG: MMPL family transporter [Myxococcota bacterium]